MQRRKFLTTTLATATVATVAATSMLAKPQTKTGNKDGFIVKKGGNRSGKPTPFMLVNPNDAKISAKDSNGQLSMFEYTGTQKIGPPLHLHYDQDEVFYVVEGEYIFQLGNTKSVLKAGDTIFLPRNIQHTWIQTSDLGKLIYFLNPAGKMEEFFDEFSKVTGPPDMAAMGKMFQEHGMKLVGPPLTLK